MNKTWKPFDDECLHCGSSAEVLTDSKEDGMAFDGDEARCTECGCVGSVNVYEESSASISWHDEPDCDCGWCNNMKKLNNLESALSASEQRNRELLEALEWVFNNEVYPYKIGDLYLADYLIDDVVIPSGKTPLEAIQSAMKEKVK